jgi:hypothetical protein
MVAARRLLLGTIAVVCALIAISGFCGGVAFAAAPEAPVLQVASRQATPGVEVGLFGFLYPAAPGEPGSYELLYKQSATECQGASKGPTGVATGNQFEFISETLTGLQAGEQYTICLAVTSPGGTTLSAPVTVTTPIAPEAATGLKAEPVGSFTATLNGTLNPSAERKVEPGSYEFLYRQSESECESEEQSATPSTVAAGAKEEDVSVPVTGLLPHTTYTFCLRQTNEVGEVATSAPATFTTLAAAPEIEETGATHVTAESATFSAKINPEGAETTYVVEYAPLGGAFVPVSQSGGSLGEGAAGVRVNAHLQGLAAHSSYEFRVTVTNALKTLTSTPVAFTTQSVGVPPSLPDGREWEMVSPPQKEGSLFWPLRGAMIVQAAADGDAFTDPSVFEPIEDSAAGAYDFFQENFFGRGAGGWASKTITPPHSATGKLPIGRGMEYRFFSEDMSKAVLQPFGPVTPLAPGVTQSTLYVHTNYLGSQGELCSEGCYQPLVSDANVPAGTPYGEEANGPCVMICGPLVVAVSPDLDHVLLQSPVGLTVGSEGGVYEWTDGELKLVGSGGVGSSAGLLRHVISDDGSRVFINGSYEGVEGLLMRDTVTGGTVRLDEPQGAGVPPAAPGHAGFEAASADGSRVFFTSEQPLVEGVSEPALYEYDANAPVGSRLTDLSKDENAGEAAGVSAVVGESEDGSYVYFAATGALASGASPAGCGAEQSCMNLYVRHAGATKFIAGLGSEDFPDWSGSEKSTVRVSPNGQWLAFMSNRDLTGYDTNDAVSGHPDEEVYLYDASTGKLVCGSCDPTGARPVGVEYGAVLTLVNGSDTIFDRATSIASNIPAWTGNYPSGAEYQSRYLSDSGRLFFDSDDALVPQDVNGTQDVYEYEPGSIGDCSGESLRFSEASGGCVSLISSGESAEESAFLDASESGGDVFFLTTSKLATQDFDNTFDIYDARECGLDSARCFAPEAVRPPACNTGDACKPSPTPQPSIFANPSSATFTGTGDLEPFTGPVVKAKGLTRVQKLQRALKACSRKKGKHRKKCERRARAQYGAAKPRKAAANKGRGR